MGLLEDSEAFKSWESDRKDVGGGGAEADDAAVEGPKKLSKALWASLGLSPVVSGEASALLSVEPVVVLLKKGLVFWLATDAAGLDTAAGGVTF